MEVKLSAIKKWRIRPTDAYGICLVNENNTIIAHGLSEEEKCILDLAMRGISLMASISERPLAPAAVDIQRLYMLAGVNLIYDEKKP